MKQDACIIIWIGLLIGACTHDKGQVVPQASCTTPAVVSYSADIQPLFNQYCATGGCHSGGSPAGNLNLTTSQAYNQLMQSGSGYIDTLQPTYSLLYAQMKSTSQPMPPTGRLDACKLDLVLTLDKAESEE